MPSAILKHQESEQDKAVGTGLDWTELNRTEQKWVARCRILVEKAIENFIMVTTIFLQRNWHKNVSTNFLHKALENCGPLWTRGGREAIKWQGGGIQLLCQLPTTPTSAHDINALSRIKTELITFFSLFWFFGDFFRLFFFFFYFWMETFLDSLPLLLLFSAPPWWGFFLWFASVRAICNLNNMAQLTVPQSASHILKSWQGERWKTDSQQMTKDAARRLAGGYM